MLCTLYTIEYFLSITQSCTNNLPYILRIQRFFYEICLKCKESVRFSHRFLNLYHFVMLTVNANVGISHNSMKISNLPTVTAAPAPVIAITNISKMPITEDTAERVTAEETERYRYLAFSTTTA